MASALFRGMTAAPRPAPVIDVELVVRKLYSSEALYLVRRDGVVLGFLSKIEDTDTDTHPWKAYEAICGQGPVRVNSRTMVPFYGRNGRTLAIDYLQTRA